MWPLHPFILFRDKYKIFKNKGFRTTDNIRKRYPQMWYDPNPLSDKCRPQNLHLFFTISRNTCALYMSFSISCAATRVVIKYYEYSWTLAFLNIKHIFLLALNCNISPTLGCSTRAQCNNFAENLKNIGCWQIQFILFFFFTFMDDNLLLYILILLKPIIS